MKNRAKKEDFKIFCSLVLFNLGIRGHSRAAERGRRCTTIMLEAVQPSGVAKEKEPERNAKLHRIKVASVSRSSCQSTN